MNISQRLLRLIFNLQMAFEYIKVHPVLFQDASIAIHRANGSRIARAESNQKTAENLNAHYFELHPPTGKDSHRHPLWFSLGRVAMIGKEIVNRHQS